MRADLETRGSANVAIQSMHVHKAAEPTQDLIHVRGFIGSKYRHIMSNDVDKRKLARYNIKDAAAEAPLLGSELSCSNRLIAFE
jgi:hypothetical protein